MSTPTGVSPIRNSSSSTTATSSSTIGNPSKTGRTPPTSVTPNCRRSRTSFDVAGISSLSNSNFQRVARISPSGNSRLRRSPCGVGLLKLAASDTESSGRDSNSSNKNPTMLDSQMMRRDSVDPSPTSPSTSSFIRPRGRSLLPDAAATRTPTRNSSMLRNNNEHSTSSSDETTWTGSPSFDAEVSSPRPTISSNTLGRLSAVVGLLQPSSWTKLSESGEESSNSSDLSNSSMNFLCQRRAQRLSTEVAGLRNLVRCHSLLLLLLATTLATLTAIVATTRIGSSPSGHHSPPPSENVSPNSNALATSASSTDVFSAFLNVVLTTMLRMAGIGSATSSVPSG